MASLHGRAGHLVFLDTRTLGVEHIPFDVAAHGLVLLVLDARALGVPTLRDAVPSDPERIADDRLRRRARHVATENARVLDMVAACGTGPIRG